MVFFIRNSSSVIEPSAKEITREFRTWLSWPQAARIRIQPSRPTVVNYLKFPTVETANLRKKILFNINTLETCSLIRIWRAPRPGVDVYFVGGGRWESWEGWEGGRAQLACVQIPPPSGGRGGWTQAKHNSVLTKPAWRTLQMVKKKFLICAYQVTWHETMRFIVWNHYMMAFGVIRNM